MLLTCFNSAFISLSQIHSNSSKTSSMSGKMDVSALDYSLNLQFNFQFRYVFFIFKWFFISFGFRYLRNRILIWRKKYWNGLIYHSSILHLHSLWIKSNRDQSWNFINEMKKEIIKCVMQYVEMLLESMRSSTINVLCFSK